MRGVALNCGAARGEASRGVALFSPASPRRAAGVGSDLCFVDRERWVSEALRGRAMRCDAPRCGALRSAAVRCGALRSAGSRPSPRRAGRVVEGSCSWNSQAMGERGEAMRCKATMSGAAVPGLDHVGLTELRTVLIVDRKRWVSGAKRCEAAQRNAGRSEAMRSGAQRWFPRLQHEGLPRLWRVLDR